MTAMAYELNPAEVLALTAALPERTRLAHLLAARGLCPRCRGDRAFRRAVDDLTEAHRKDLPAILREAKKTAAQLMADAATLAASCFSVSTVFFFAAILLTPPPARSRPR
jgi:hypothetical protein